MSFRGFRVCIWYATYATFDLPRVYDAVLGLESGNAAAPRQRLSPPARMLIVAELPLAASTAALIGAIEIAVHTSDISWACGRPRPIPAALALDLLKISRRVLDGGARDPQFAAEVPVSPMAAAGDRLVAFLGRPRVSPPTSTAGSTRTRLGTDRLRGRLSARM
jgi:hypothetical protein